MTMRRSWFSKGNQPQPPHLPAYTAARLAGIHSTKLMSATAKREARSARRLAAAARGGYRRVNE